MYVNIQYIHKQSNFVSTNKKIVLINIFTPPNIGIFHISIWKTIMSRGWLIPTEKDVEYRPNDEKEELFVFGYGCKLFRDDEKALLLDRGSHLIPWMGDNKVLIDRSVCQRSQV